MKKPSSLLLAALAAVSCLSDPEPGEFCPPRIVSTTSVVERNVVALSCEVAGNRGVKECGFLFGRDEEPLERTACEWDGDGSFSLTVEGLTFDVDYWYGSFISSGHDEQRSETRHFKIRQRLPEIEIASVTDRTSSSAVVEYAVGENFSGELIVCGLCWGTEPEPTIESSGKTVDSARYGTHRTRITGLDVGKTYHVRAYAINSKGTAYSEDVAFYAPVSFADSAFSEYMLGIGDADGDGYISVEEAGNIREIDLCSDGVGSLDGIGHCTSLVKLRCSGSAPGAGKLKATDLSDLQEIEELDLSCNLLAGLDLSRNGKLRSARLEYNSMSTLKLPESSALESLDLEDNMLTDIHLSELSGLVDIDLSRNRLGSVSIGGLPALKTLKLAGNPLSELSVPPHSEIEELDLNGTQLSGLSDIFRNARGLKRLYVRGVLHDGDELYLLPQLEELDCYGSGISRINIRFNHSLVKVLAADCVSLSSLNVCLNSSLGVLDCRGCTALKTIYMVEDQKIDGINANLSLGLRRPENAVMVYSSRVDDPVFARCLVESFDRDFDGFVCITEVEDVEELAVDSGTYSGIASVHGLEMFRSLKKLSLPGQNLVTLDLSANTGLTDLNCDSNPLTDLSLGSCASLVNLYCQSAGLHALDLSGCPELAAVHLYNNALRSLDCSGNPHIRTLDCSANRLEGVLDLSACTELGRLDCSGNKSLSEVILSASCASSVEIVKDAQCVISYR